MSLRKEETQSRPQLVVGSALAETRYGVAVPRWPETPQNSLGRTWLGCHCRQAIERVGIGPHRTRTIAQWRPSTAPGSRERPAAGPATSACRPDQYERYEPGAT